MDMKKRTDGMILTAIQDGNRSWWTRNTMSYDWNEKVSYEKFSLPWFEEVDSRFIRAAHLYATDKNPFDKVIPFEKLSGKKVLEIGCGMGFHSELMARAGAEVTAIDLSPTSIEATTKRFKLKKLTAQAIMQADAENLYFDDNYFDFVWSWGVIHHSSRTVKIIREISRVLKPDGQCRVMVYNRCGSYVPLVFIKDFLMKGKFLNFSFEEVLYQSTDGFSARFYVPEQFKDIFDAFFQTTSIHIYGQEADVIPLPRQLRHLALKFASENWMKRRQAKSGSFIFVEASNPL